MPTRLCASRRVRCLAFKPEKAVWADGGEDFAVRRDVDRVVAWGIDDAESRAGSFSAK